MPGTLRDYQQTAIERLFAAYEMSHRSAMLVMATGLGKSVTLAEAARRVIESGKRVMVLAHRERLIRQLARTLEWWCEVTPDIEMAGEYAAEHLLMSKSPIVVSTIQTQASGKKGDKRRDRFDPSEFGMLIIDETHRALSKSYRETIDHYMSNPECRLLGVTATPDRADGRAMGIVYDCCPFQMDIRAGIGQGYLVPIKSRTVTVESLSLEGIRKVAGELDGKQLAAALEEDRPLHEIAGAIRESMERYLGFGPKQTIAFCHRVAQAQAVADICNAAKEDTARVIYGGTPDEERNDIYLDFDELRYPLLVNCDVLTEGYDCPEIRCVVVAKPTLSRGRFVQMVGRGLRPLPGVIDGIDSAEDRRAAIAASAKPDCKVIIIDGHGSAHSLVTTADVLGGNYNEAVVKRAAEMAAESGEMVDMEEMLGAAEQRIAEEAKQKREEEERRRQLAAKARISGNITDLFGCEPPATDPELGRRLRQAEILRKARVPNAVINRLPDEELARLSRELVRRWKRGLCTYWQGRKLRELGYDPTEMSFEDATRIITAHKKGVAEAVA